MSLDVDFVRRQYPIYARPDRADWAFFENAGGSYVPRQVSDRLSAFFCDYKVQPYGPFDLAVEAGAAMDAGYQCIAGLLNATVDQLTLGPSTTMNCYVLAQALRPRLRPGDEIIVTNQDHEANIGCWQRLAEFGVTIKTWEIDRITGELNLDQLQRLLTKRSRAVCFTLCSNIVGTINDAHAVADLAHQYGALAIADGVSYAPHTIVDVNQLGADVYLFSTYKTFGTHVGVMWMPAHVAEQLAPQGHYFNTAKANYRMNPAGPQHAEIAALAGIGTYLDALYEHHFDTQIDNPHDRFKKIFAILSEHKTQLANEVLDTLRILPGVRIIGQDRAVTGHRAPTISFVPGTVRPSDLAKRLAREKIAVRNGHFYALRCVEALGIEDPEEGVLRISLVHYNTTDEVRRLTGCLQAMLG